MSEVRAQIARAVRAALDALGGEAVEAGVELSARPEFGDWSTPAPLRAARVLRRPPMVIAEELRGRLDGAVEAVAEWTVSSPGYVNARLADAAWAEGVVAAALGLDPGRPLRLPDASPQAALSAGKTVVEHTSINTNKAAHIGHLRNACIGDTVARLLRRLGVEVEVENYIDDTGVQVADVVVGIRELGMVAGDDEPYDRFCSRVYVEVMRRYGSAPELLERRREVLREIERRDNETARFAKQLAGRIVEAHLRTMARFDIGYDLLTWESDILELGFWDRAFGLLRDAGVIVLAGSGKNEGCWLLPHVEAEPGTPDAVARAGDGSGDGRDAKVLVKSDGVATYTAKDIAYQLWKFGLLGVDFHYRPWGREPGAPATSQSSAEGATLERRRFGRAARVVTVIDARQAYPQGILRAALARLGHSVEAQRSVHLAYEVVALSPRAAAELGFKIDEGGGGVALSGRRGIEVRADDLLDRAVARLAPKARDAGAAAALAAGAVRWYLLRFTLPVQIVFDFDEALRTTGDTGVYVQYAHARAAGILRRVGDPGPGWSAPATLHPADRALLHRLDTYTEALGEAAEALAPAVLTGYAFGLACAFTDFYERTPPIAREQDKDLRGFRRALVAATKTTLADVLGVLGIRAPDSI